MIKTVSLSGLARDDTSCIPKGAIVLCPKCLLARAIIGQDIRSNSRGGWVMGTSGSLSWEHWNSAFLGKNQHCPECGIHILWDGKRLNAGNEPYPACRFQGTYIEPDSFISYIVGYMMIGSQNYDPCSEVWQYWARKSPAVAQG